MNVKASIIPKVEKNINADSLKKPTKKSSMKNFLSQLSGGFMLPISIMAFAGIFLGVGATIMAKTDAGNPLIGIPASAGHVFGAFVQAIGNTVFGILPLLFAISMSLAFSNQSGIAGFSALIIWFGMNTISSIFLVEHYVPSSEWYLGVGKEIDHYSVLGIGSIWGNIDNNLVTANAGITSFSTSVFGAIIAGGLAAYAYNRFHTMELPTFIGFFSGARCVPIISLLISILIALCFIFIWPIFGYGLSAFGNSLSTLKYGTNALIFGFVERALLPFGLHHVFYAPLWWSSAGGSLDSASLANSIWLAAGSPDAAPHATLMDIINNPQFYNSDYVQLAKKFDNALNDPTITGPSGSINVWFWLQHLGLAKLPFNNNGTIGQMPIFDWITKYDHKLVSPGAFDQGKYPFIIFGLPAAGAAMIMTAPKENRKFAASIIISAATTTFLTGITEPIEFTFLFLAPWLFWGIHAPLCGISFWLMALFGGHIGMSFSGGFLDLIIYGIIPMSLGTNFWIVFILGPIYGVLYFTLFYFLIKRFDIKTPGRGTIQLFSRVDWKSRGANLSNFKREATIIAGFGGYSNITKFANCATRLRYDVVDPSLVNIDMIKSAGATAVIKIGKSHFQAIVGGKASVINEKINFNRQEIEEEMGKDNIKPTLESKTLKLKQTPVKRSSIKK